MTERFQGIIGHRAVTDLLTRELANPAQAYLLTGASGVGKSVVALEFARLLLCPGLGEHEPDCRSCRLTSGGNHPDLVVVEPEGATSLGVDQARSVIGRAAMLPVESIRTVFVIPDAGSMTEQAANALLKTLEEPSASAMFILAAESEDDLPSTVGSRCRTVHLGRVPLGDIVDALMERGLARDEATSVAAVSGGRPGLALALMNHAEVAGFRDRWLSIPGQVSPHPGDGHRLARSLLLELAPLVEGSLSNDLPKDKRQRAARRAEMSLLVSGLEILASWYSDSASLQMGGPVRNSDLPLGPFTDVTPRKAVESAELVLDAVVDIQGNLRRELVLANLFASLGSAQR